MYLGVKAKRMSECHGTRESTVASGIVTEALLLLEIIQSDTARNRFRSTILIRTVATPQTPAGKQ
jgi:hypothetical protein